MGLSVKDTGSGYRFTNLTIQESELRSQNKSGIYFQQIID